MKVKILEPTHPNIVISIDALYTTFAYLYSPSFTYEGETHDPWEIVFINNGEVIVNTQNESMILKKNQMVIHAPNEYHSIKANNKPCSVGIITFGSSSNELFKLVDKIIDVSETEKDSILSIINEGLILMAGKNYMPLPSNRQTIPYGSSQLIKNTLENLLISIARKQLHEDSNKSITSMSFHKNNIVQSAVMFINENVEKKLTLKDISKSVGYSVSYISAVFKKHLGTSLINYFLKLRIMKAKQLIEEDKHSFNEIAEILGFDSVQYFSTQFKKIANLTPSQYSTMLKIGKYKFDDVNTYLLK